MTGFVVIEEEGLLTRGRPNGKRESGEKLAEKRVEVLSDLEENARARKNERNYQKQEGYQTEEGRKESMKWKEGEK